MQNVVIYFPKNEAYFEVGAKVIESGKETPKTVTKIEEEDRKIKVSFSDKTQLIYANIPWTSKIINK
jgi:hypothetical protein